MLQNSIKIPAARLEILGYPFGVPIWGTPAPPSEIDDFPGVPLLGPPGSASDFKGAGTPHGESNVELYPICKRCSADPLKRGVG